MAPTNRWLLCVVALGIFILPCAGKADFTPMGYRSSPSGGAASPKSDHPTVRMESEEVMIRLKPYSYAVEAVFHMVNSGEKTTERVGFPKRGEGTPPSFDGVTDFIRFETRVNGKKMPFWEERETSALSYFVNSLSSLPPEGGPPRGPTKDYRWMLGNITFQGHTKTMMTLSYDAPYLGCGMNCSRAVYIYGTGRHWKDSIGKAVFIIDSTEQGGIRRAAVRFSEGDTKNHSIRRMVISENVERYEVGDLEPVPDGELTITIIDRQRDRHDSDPLFNAASNGRLKEVRAILNKGTDADTRTPFGDTALMKAAWGGHLAVAKLLVEKGADPNAENQRGMTAMKGAMLEAWFGSGQVEMARFLRDRGAKPTTLSVAAFIGDVEAVQRFVAEGVNVNQSENPDARTTPLMAAAMGGDSSTVKFLINSGAEVDAKNALGQTALMAAAVHGRSEAMKALLDRGADANAKSRNYGSALYHAVSWSRSERESMSDTVRVLLNGGADVNTRDEPFNRTILMNAALQGSLKTVNLLLDRGADVNAKDSKGSTALNWARGKDIEEIEKVLKAHGAKK